MICDIDFVVFRFYTEEWLLQFIVITINCFFLLNPSMVDKVDPFGWVDFKENDKRANIKLAVSCQLNEISLICFLFFFSILHGIGSSASIGDS